MICLTRWTRQENEYFIVPWSSFTREDPRLQEFNMQLAPFLLDHWLNHYHFGGAVIEHDLASSTGPNWTLGQLLALEDESDRQALLDAKLVYVDGAGTRALREAIAEMQRVSPDEVIITTGAAEALLILFFLAAQLGANAILP